MSPEEISYYRERAKIEHALAEQSQNPHAAEIHAKLAALYEKLVEVDQAITPLAVVEPSRLSA